jgi:hypothetical protein
MWVIQLPLEALYQDRVFCVVWDKVGGMQGSHRSKCVVMSPTISRITIVDSVYILSVFPIRVGKLSALSNYVTSITGVRLFNFRQ